MLIEFSTANFKSFKTMQTLSMRAANILSKDKEMDTNNVRQLNDKIRTLTSKAIYGANASGKSNLVKAFLAFITIVGNSVKDENILKRWVRRYELDFEAETQPTFFQMIFALENEENKPIVYRYGFEVFNNQIISEWLFGVPKRVEVPYFIREEMKITVNERVFREAKKFEDLTKQGDNEIFRNNSLFVSAVSSMGGRFSKNVIKSITGINILSGIDDPMINEFASEKLETPNEKQEILELLKAADFGIEDIGKLKTDDEIGSEEFYTKRSKYVENKKVTEIVVDFDEWESQGTKKFFFMSPLLIGALKEGRTLIIDEFDARLHPLLTRKIVSLFNSTLTNKTGAQLIFVTHDTNFLKSTLLRRDQICFIEKNNFGSSTIKTLVEFKGIRNDATFDKEYIQGKYGAVPFLNEMDKKFTK